MGDTKIYWDRFRRSPLAVLIGINTAVFVIVSLVYAISHVALPVWLGLQAPLDYTLSRPWGIFTYMFVQTDVLHLLFNMMWLWAFGAIMTRNHGARRMVQAYLWGGAGGAVGFVIAATAMGIDMPIWLIGSSASVLGIITFTAVRNPGMELELVLFGRVRLLWIAIFAIVLCGLVPGLEHAPTLCAHAGGVAAGIIYALTAVRLPSRKQFTPGQRPRNVRLHQQHGLTDKEQAELDRLLGIVRQSGFKSLSTKEKQQLIALSGRIRK